MKLLGAVLLMLMVYIIGTDLWLMAEGFSHKTALYAIHRVNASMGLAGWNAYVVYYFPVLIGVLSLTPSSIRREE